MTNRPTHPTPVAGTAQPAGRHDVGYDPDDPATGPADWHHQLAATRPRLHAAVARTGCKPGEHRPPTLPGWATDPPPHHYSAALASHIATDLGTRH